jgi:error-prone DNA polymerase
VVRRHRPPRTVRRPVLRAPRLTQSVDGPRPRRARRALPHPGEPRRPRRPLHLRRRQPALPRGPAHARPCRGAIPSHPSAGPRARHHPHQARRRPDPHAALTSSASRPRPHPHPRPQQPRRRAKPGAQTIPGPPATPTRSASTPRPLLHPRQPRPQPGRPRCPVPRGRPTAARAAAPHRRCRRRPWPSPPGQADRPLGPAGPQGRERPAPRRSRTTAGPGDRGGGTVVQSSSAAFRAAPMSAGTVHRSTGRWCSRAQATVSGSLQASVSRAAPISSWRR